MSSQRVTRRHALSTVATLGVTSLAGCSRSNLGDDADSSESKSTPDPTPPAEALATAGWEEFKTDHIEQTTSIEAPLGKTIEFTASGTSRLYEDAQLRARIREGTLGKLDSPLRVFFATKLGLDPNVLGMPAGVGTKEVLDEIQSYAESSFERELGSMGLEGLEVVEETTLDIATGETARLRTYESTYPYEGFTVPLTDERSLTIDGGEIRFEAMLALWERDDRILIAGGGHPGENFKTSEQIEVTDIISADIDIDLGFSPADYRAELRTLMSDVR